jgi:hypothetical protein
MKLRALPLLLLPVLCSAVARAEGPAVPAPGEQSIYDVRFMGMKSGRVELTVGLPTERNHRKVTPVVGVATSGGLASLYPLFDRYVCFWDVERQRTAQGEFTANERNHRWRESIQFDEANQKVNIDRVREDGSAEHKSISAQAGAVDVVGAVVRLRTLELAVGKHFDIPVSTDASAFTMTATVEGTEQVETPRGKVEAYRVSVKTGFGEKLRATRDVQVFLTTDPAHVPVRIEAELVVGSFTAELVEFHGVSTALPAGAWMSAAR